MCIMGNFLQHEGFRSLAENRFDLRNAFSSTAVTYRAAAQSPNAAMARIGADAIPYTVSPPFRLQCTACGSWRGRFDRVACMREWGLHRFFKYIIVGMYNGTYDRYGCGALYARPWALGKSALSLRESSVRSCCKLCPAFNRCWQSKLRPRRPVSFHYCLAGGCDGSVCPWLPA